MTFSGTELWQKERRSNNLNLIVSKTRFFLAIRAEIIIALQQCMTNQLHIDENTCEKVREFVRLVASESDVSEVHDSIALTLICVILQINTMISKTVN